MRKGAQTLVFGSKPVILSRAAIGGLLPAKGGKEAKTEEKK